MSYRVEAKKLSPQPTVSVHREVPMPEIGSVMQQAIPQTWTYAETHGGGPTAVYARFVSVGPATAVFDVGVELTKPIEGAGEIAAGELPGGEVAYALYTGPYDGMEPAYHAIEEWMKANGRKPAGAPWEVYLSDPQREPDPQGWKTEIYWPIA